MSRSPKISSSTVCVAELAEGMLSVMRLVEGCGSFVWLYEGFSGGMLLAEGGAILFIFLSKLSSIATSMSLSSSLFALKEFAIAFSVPGQVRFTAESEPKSGKCSSSTDTGFTGVLTQLRRAGGVRGGGGGLSSGLGLRLG